MNVFYEATKTGFKFEIKMARGLSEGYQQMKVFCYDVMINEIWSYIESKPRFLIHDRIIFGNVAEKQKGRALRLAKEKADNFGFQYFFALNSDMVPRDELDEHFNVRDSARLTLANQDATSGLLGIKVVADTAQSGSLVLEDEREEE